MRVVCYLISSDIPLLLCKHCPIATPRDYKESLEQRKHVTEQIKSQLASIFESSQQHADPTEEELKKQQLAANAAISKKFMVRIACDYNGVFARYCMFIVSSTHTHCRNGL